MRDSSLNDNTPHQKNREFDDGIMTHYPGKGLKYFEKIEK